MVNTAHPNEGQAKNDVGSSSRRLSWTDIRPNTGVSSGAPKRRSSLAVMNEPPKFVEPSMADLQKPKAENGRWSLASLFRSKPSPGTTSVSAGPSPLLAPASHASPASRSVPSSNPSPLLKGVVSASASPLAKNADGWAATRSPAMSRNASTVGTAPSPLMRPSDPSKPPVNASFKEAR
jgi:hypothetical protein